MIKAVFFDLFFTLIYPGYSDLNEYDIVGITPIEWEKYAENDALYYERAIGKIKTEKEIIDKIVNIMPYDLNKCQIDQLLQRREDRMKRALLTIDDNIMDTLKRLHEKDVKIGLISNADVIDSKYWYDSPLSQFFEEVIFSCDVGILKPDLEIYKLAMNRLDVKPEECIFIGDGGSDELYGAKCAGMKTIFTEYLECKVLEKRGKIQQHADYHIDDFSDLLKYVW